MIATIDVWMYDPATEGNVFLKYRIAGTVDGKPFCGVVSVEIDGCDGEYESLWGVDVAPGGIRGKEWIAVSTAIGNTSGLEADMAARTAAYYGE